jgi:DNA-binding NarL/FixJ family response regulator
MHDQSRLHPTTARPLQVLLVASDRRMRAALQALVEAEGRYVVIAEARTSGEAVALDRSLHPQLILLDLLLPTTEDGLDAVRLLARGNARPIVVISAQAALRPTALAAEAVGFAVQGDEADLVLAVISAANQHPPSAAS